MDLWTLQIKITGRCSYQLKNYHWYDKPISWKLVSFDAGKVSNSRVSRGAASCNRYRSYVVRATGKKNSQNNSDSSSSDSGNGDHSNPERDGVKGNNPGESNDTGSMMSQHDAMEDWREFRARLFINQEQMLDEQAEGVNQESKRLAPKWAHPLTSHETGCVLVATEKLDGDRTFDRSVVFLLGSGTKYPQEGPFGVIINRSLNKKIRHMTPTNHHLATTFADCLLHFGGPLEASMFLMRTGGKTDLIDFEEVIPGLCFGARNSLEEAAAMVKKGVVKPHDFRFFVGYAGWQLDQLREEIEAGLWHVAACSSNLIFGGQQRSSSERLWEEILQLMGGSYSELSRKPKQDI